MVGSVLLTSFLPFIARNRSADPDGRTDLEGRINQVQRSDLGREALQAKGMATKPDPKAS